MASVQPSRSVIRTLQRQLSSGERSAAELTEAYLAAIAAAQPELNAYSTVCEAQARAAAAAVDAARARGEPLGALAGVPLSVKDNICTRGVTTSAGSRVLAAYAPPYDATAWQRLAAAGCVLLGKTNMDEFGMGSSTETSTYGATRNPWDVSRVPGGSSGGAAAAVAAGLCAGALGSDTGGSVRQPASFCGCVGLKPTYGRVSRSGLVAYASSLDAVGFLAPSVEDAALLLAAAAGRDAADATSWGGEVPDYAAALPPAEALPSAPLRGLRVGLISQTAGEGVQPAVLAVLRGAAGALEALGARVLPITLPSYDAGLPAYYVIAPAEASSNLARYDGLRYGALQERPSLRGSMEATRAAGFGDEVKRRILMGTYVLSAGYVDAYYGRAERVRAAVAGEMTRALATECDLLLSPVAPSAAYARGAKAGDALSMYLGDLMTVNVNLAGLPALSLPAGFAPPEEGGDARLPVGVQLIGRRFGEAELLRVAHVLEVTRPRLDGPPGFPGPAGIRERV